MTTKIFIFDASSLINLTMNGLEDILPKLKNKFKGKFIMPESVKYEVIDRPMNIKKFKLGALKLRDLLKKRVLELPSSLKIKGGELNKKAKSIEKLADKSFSTRDKFIELIQAGESECLALSLICQEKGIQSMIVVDERTTRMLVEKPENLKKVFEKKLHSNIVLHPETLPKLPKIKIIRSAELIWLAHKMKLIEFNANGELLDALLYASKYKGCAISRQEIEELKKL